MSIYQLEPPDPSEDRRSALRIVITLGLIVLIVGGLSALVFLAEDRLAFGPTPTPTATAKSPSTPTRDFGATRVAENFLTQEAYPAGNLGIDTGRGTRVALVTPTAVATTPVVDTGAELAVTPVLSVTSVSNLPIVVRPEEQSTPPTATPTPTPLPTETETPAPTPTETPTQAPEIPSPTPPAIPTAETMPTPTPTRYTRTNIPARVQSGGADAREGPSIQYNVMGQYTSDRDVSLLGRTASGEWLQACCIEENRVYWLRAAQVALVTLTPTPEALPTEIAEQYASTRWLEIKQPETGLEPLPVATSIVPGTFPLYRYDNSGRGLIPRVPAPPLEKSWEYDSGNPFSSGAVAGTSSVATANVDPRLYGVNRNSNTQRFRTDLRDTARLTPALHDSAYFLVDQAGRLYRFEIQESQPVQVWEVNPGVLPNPIMGQGINLGHDYLYYTGTNSQQQRELIMVRRSDGQVMSRFLASGEELSYPVIGDQLVYVGGSEVWARELTNVTSSIWTYRELSQPVSAPPAYVTPGRRALAELYVGERGGEIRILDANTGALLANFNTGGEVSGIAVDEARIYITTNTQLLAYRLEDLGLAWNQNLESRAMGGPLTDGRRVIVTLESGAIRVYQADNGAVQANEATAALGGAPVITGQDIYLPGADGKVHYWRGSGIE